VLEFAEQGSIRDLLRRKDMLVTLEDMTLRMAGEIASGMHYLHTRPRPVIHRDIKSENVLVTAAFEAKLADFGVPDVRGWWSGVAPTLVGLLSRCSLYCTMYSCTPQCTVQSPECSSTMYSCSL
jgi:serine/threonine protein kinase